MTTPLLGLDPEELVACVACGLCLPHCPTYRVTGLEIASPRGRIAAMRAVEAGDAPLDEYFVRAMDECVQCRGCEAACPSSVPFGSLMESTRAALAAPVGPAPKRAMLHRALESLAYRWILPRHALLIALSWIVWFGQRLRLVPRRFGAPALSLASLRTRLDVARGGDPECWLFVGCVMDAWQRPTHRAALRVLSAQGYSVALPNAGADCCGALHVHSGRTAEAKRLAQRVMASMPGEAPIVVDSAGCGAALKDYGTLLDTDGARAFASRISDFSEFVARRRDSLSLRSSDRRVIIQDSCHLRHVQKAHGAVRTVLAGVCDMVDTADEGLCCGAGGAYVAQQPQLARAIRDRKVAAIEAAGAGDDFVVCSANPGCTIHLQQAGFTVLHPAELLADAIEENR